MKCQVLQAFTKPKPQFSDTAFSVCSLRWAAGRFQFETQWCGLAHDAVGRGSVVHNRACLRESFDESPRRSPSGQAAAVRLPGYLLQVAISSADAVLVILGALRELFPVAR
jgi:hypothetical protein